MAASDVLCHYYKIYSIETAFRITKHDLDVRPVIYQKPDRMKTHIAICFCAYALVKHLEYSKKLIYKKMSPEKIRNTLVKVQTSILFDQKKKIRYGLPLRPSADARKIYEILKIKKTITPYIIKKLQCLWKAKYNLNFYLKCGSQGILMDYFQKQLILISIQRVCK